MGKYPERFEFRTTNNVGMLIEELAKERGKPVSEIIRNLVERSLDKIYEDTRMELENIDKRITEEEKELRELKKIRDHLHNVVKGKEEK